jgi:hypothetical protein
MEEADGKVVMVQVALKSLRFYRLLPPSFVLSFFLSKSNGCLYTMMEHNYTGSVLRR